MSNETPGVGKAEEVRIQLSTRHTDLELPEKTGPIVISTGVRRYALSSLVNTLLESKKPMPFEFLINGQFLRTSIEVFLTQNGISAETTLAVEYVRALLPPVHQGSFEHDDWVTSVDVLSNTSPAAIWAGRTVRSGDEKIVSASYDGILRVWGMSSTLLASTPASNNGLPSAIKAAKFISPTQIASAGYDMRVRIWDYSELDDLSSPAALQPALDLHGHKAHIESLAIHSPTSRILSSSFDSTAALWSTSPTDASPASTHFSEPAITSSKRRKLSKATSAPQSRGALTTLTSHSGPITSAIFHPNDPTAAYSTSVDTTLKTWDLETSRAIDTRRPSSTHALFAVAGLKRLGLVAVGTSAGTVTLVDPRVSARTAAVGTLRGHRKKVVAVAAEPEQGGTGADAGGAGFSLVSGSHDGCCRIWDVRSVRASGATGGDGAVGAYGGGGASQSVYRLPRAGKPNCDRVDGGEGVKVLDVCWDGDVGIVSAGEDRRVQVDKSMGES